MVVQCLIFRSITLLLFIYLKKFSETIKLIQIFNIETLIFFPKGGGKNYQYMKLHSFTLQFYWISNWKLHGKLYIRYWHDQTTNLAEWSFSPNQIIDLKNILGNKNDLYTRHYGNTW